MVHMPFYSCVQYTLIISVLYYSFLPPLPFVPNSLASILSFPELICFILF